MEVKELHVEEVLQNVEEVRKMLAQRYVGGLALVNKAILAHCLKLNKIFISGADLNAVSCYYGDEAFLSKIRSKGYTVTKVEPCHGEDGGIVVEGWE